MTIYQIIFRAILAVLLGGFIGTERAKHGRAAGMRTHILVCLGSALTSMTGVFVNQTFGGGDVLRISAQVISGIGFLGAGMIILKNGNIVTGLTTAAGMWTTAAIGIALGYGFYVGAVAVSVLYLISVIYFAKLEKNRRHTEVLYLEIDDMSRTNAILEELQSKIPVKYKTEIIPPKSEKNGNLGIVVTIKELCKIETADFLQIENVVFVIED